MDAVPKSSCFATSVDDPVSQLANLAAIAELERLDRMAAELKPNARNVGIEVAPSTYGAVKPPKQKARAIRWHDAPSDDTAKQLSKLHDILMQNREFFHDFCVKLVEGRQEVNVVSVAKWMAYHIDSDHREARQNLQRLEVKTASSGDLRTPAGMTEAIRKIAQTGEL